MKNIASRIVLCLLVCLLPYFLFISDTCAQETLKKDSDVLKNSTRSSIKKLATIYERLYSFPPQSGYKSIGYSSDWQSNEDVVLIQSKKGKFFEVDRWDEETTLGAKIEFAYIPSTGTDYGAIIIGYEPNEINDTCLIKIYDLKKREKIGSFWSSEEPLFDDIDGDEQTEMVIFKNIFALDLPGLPNWPIIVRFQNGLIIDDLYKYRGFIVKHLELTRKEKTILQNDCKILISKSGYCPLKERIKSLEMQEKYLEKIFQK